jgi:hypothetical protein
MIVISRTSHVTLPSASDGEQAAIVPVNASTADLIAVPHVPASEVGPEHRPSVDLTEDRAQLAHAVLPP